VRLDGPCCEFPGVGALVGAWFELCAATMPTDSIAATHVLPKIRPVMSPPLKIDVSPEALQRRRRMRTRASGDPRKDARRSDRLAEMPRRVLGRMKDQAAHR